jgi:hypothetical protein
MLASYPASMVNQKQGDLGIPNRFDLTPSRFRSRFDEIEPDPALTPLFKHDLFGRLALLFPDPAVPFVAP